jgi:SAM-dependent methyltransferase
VNSPSNILGELYPETRVGGFSSVDGTVQFFVRVNALLSPGMTVVDFGAGRGEYACDDLVGFRRDCRILKGKVERVIGLDVDAAVLSNPAIDEAHVVAPNEQWPIAAESVDLILSDHTFEHIDDPRKVVAEFDRVLKPGGWVCARTPNKWGYIGLGARVVPNSKHMSLLKKLQPQRNHIDVFPTRYRLNTQKAIHRYFPAPSWNAILYTWNAQPAYFSNSALAWNLMHLLFRMTPRKFGATLMLFAQKNGTLAFPA